MKLSINTLGCPEKNLDEVIAISKELGVQGIEIRGISGKMNVSDIPDIAPENANKFISKLKEADLAPICFGVSSSFHNEKNTKVAINEAKEAIICAYNCRIGAIRVFGNNLPASEDQDVTIRRVAGHIRNICLFSEDYRNNHAQNKPPVKILLEAHGDFNTAQIISKTASIVDSEYFGIVWDVAHTHRGMGDNILDFWKENKDIIHHLHIKDHKKTDTGYTLCPVGEGDIPLREIFEAITADGFDGFFSLESEKAWHPELPSIEEEGARFVKLFKNFNKNNNK